MLAHTALIIDIEYSVDGGLSIDGKANFMLGHGAHAGSFSGSQDNREFRGATGHTQAPLLMRFLLSYGLIINSENLGESIEMIVACQKKTIDIQPKYVSKLLLERITSL
jgi:hypothetical protein